MNITTDQIKALRDQTGVSVIQCKQALEEADGNMEQATLVLRRKGSSIASGKAGRTFGAGIVQSYIHTGSTVGSMVELLCETDFVAKNDEFKALAYDIAMQIAATDPVSIATDEVDAKTVLLSQPFIKDEDRTVGELVDSAIQKFGEKVEIGEFTRYSI